MMADKEKGEGEDQQMGEGERDRDQLQPPLTPIPMQLPAATPSSSDDEHDKSTTTKTTTTTTTTTPTTTPAPKGKGGDGAGRSGSEGGSASSSSDEEAGSRAAAPPKPKPAAAHKKATKKKAATASGGGGEEEEAKSPAVSTTTTTTTTTPTTSTTTKAKEKDAGDDTGFAPKTAPGGHASRSSRRRRKEPAATPLKSLGHSRPCEEGLAPDHNPDEEDAGVVGKPRIHTLEIDNFKSYRGHHSIGPFRDFHAIIGPNGSGKSNLMDAISFVLGVQASHLRGTRLKDLVYHQGVEKVRGKASVKLTFITASGDSISFSRTITPSGSSDYKIGNKSVGEKEYQNQLKSLNILVKARNFLVFQGDVASIASKSGKELTQLFELISGSGELAQEYETAKQQKEQNEDTTIFNFHKMKGLNAEKKDYKKMKQEAEHFQELKTQQGLLQKNLMLCQLRHIAKELKRLSPEKTDLDSKLEELNSRVRLSEKELTQKKKEQADKVKEHRKIESEIKTLLVQADNLRPEIITSQTAITRATSSLKENKNGLLKAEHELVEQEKEIKLISSHLEQITQAKQEYERQYSTEVKNSVKLSPENRRRYIALQEQVKKKTAEWQSKLERENHLQRQDAESVKAINLKIEDIQSQINPLAENRDNLMAWREKVRTISEDTASQLDTMAQSMATTKEQRQQDTERMEHLTRLTEKVQESLNSLRQDKHEHERSQRMGAILKNLKDLFPTVKGQVVDLCSPIKRKYNAAMTVAMGRYMDAIIVDKQDVARECIQYLKARRIGQATFLPLDSITPKPINEKLRSISPNVKLAIDIIKFDPEIQRALQFVLGNTLVTESVEEARRICFSGKERYRAVTIDGTLIEKSGLMTGGLSGVEGRAARWDEKEVNALKKQKEKYTKDMDDLTRKLRKEGDIAQDEVQLSGLKEKLMYSRKDLEDTENKIKHLNVQIEELDKGKRTLVPAVEELKREMAERALKIKEYEKEIATVAEKQFADFGREVGVPDIHHYEENREKRLSELNDKLVECSTQISKLTNQRDFAQHRDIRGAVKKFRETIANLEAKLVQHQEKEKKSKVEVDNISRKVDVLRKKSKVQKAMVDEKDIEIRQIQKQVDEETANIRRAEKSLSDIETRVDKLCSLRHDTIQRSRVTQITLPTIGEGDIGTYNDETQSVADTSGKEAAQAEAKEELYRREDEIEFDFSSIETDEYEVHRAEQYEALKHTLEERLTKVEAEISRLAPNMKAIEHLDGVTDRLKAAHDGWEHSVQQSKDAATHFLEVQERRTTLFKKAFQSVSDSIETIYKQLTTSAENREGGNAFLSLENLNEPYLGGITYNPMPPRKRFHDLEQLSGGEKTMAALALLFAIHKFQPAPFFLLDEIDAALDPSNVSQLARFLKDKSREFQCIVISLKPAFFDRADALLGVAKDQETQSSLSFTLDLTPYSG
ncbi:structural maintenance of chromosomes protein 1 [Pelomyxa schiedti]|nr:structural maintenance of chromosomes protein 1 [Pelomyxa schiedti]